MFVVAPIFATIWLGFSGFMIWMTLGHGGFTDGAFPYGNLVGLMMWQLFGGGFTFATLWVWRSANHEKKDNA